MPTNIPRRERAPGLGQTELARLLGCTPETIRNWTLDGCPRRDDGSYVVAEVFTWVRKWDRDRASKDAKPKKEQTELNRKLSVEADLKEMQLAQLRSEMLPAEMFEERVSRIVGGFAAVAAGRLARFERAIVQTLTAPAARKLTAQIHEALMRGAQDLADELEEEARNAPDTEDAA